jgi:hypothetical protein
MLPSKLDRATRGCPRLTATMPTFEEASLSEQGKSSHTIWIEVSYDHLNRIARSWLHEFSKCVPYTWRQFIDGKCYQGRQRNYSQKIESEDCFGRPAESPSSYANWHEDQEHIRVAAEKCPPYCAGEMEPEGFRWSPFFVQRQVDVLVGW